MAARRPARPLSERHVAFLRGVNVGGNRLVAMTDVRAAFEDAGAEEVSTYLQSGNVRFTAPAAACPAIASKAAAILRARHGIDVPVVVRSVRALAEVVHGNPLLARDPTGATLHVAFLGSEPDATRRAALDARRSPPDVLSVVGSEVFLHLPLGVARTRFTNAYLDRVLGTVSTLRTWRTVRSLAEPDG